MNVAKSIGPVARILRASSSRSDGAREAFVVTARAYQGGSCGPLSNGAPAWRLDGHARPDRTGRDHVRLAVDGSCRGGAGPGRRSPRGALHARAAGPSGGPRRADAGEGRSVPGVRAERAPAAAGPVRERSPLGRYAPPAPPPGAAVADAPGFGAAWHQ